MIENTVVLAVVINEICIKLHELYITSLDMMITFDFVRSLSNYKDFDKIIQIS